MCDYIVRFGIKGRKKEKGLKEEEKNLIGLPLSLFRFPKRHKTFVKSEAPWATYRIPNSV